MRNVAWVCAMLLAVLGCSGKTSRMEVGKDVVSDPTAVSVQDFETVGQQMARSLIQLPQIQNAAQPPTIAFLPVENRSNDFIDKQAFQEKMRSLLVQNGNGKLLFLDRQHLDELKAERDAKDAGQLTSSGDAKFYGADYFLTGVISSINAAGGSEKTVFRRYAFRLTDARTSVIIWEHEYESQVYHKRGMMYR
jgi:PBP1b-binding outer membrane lipoprotein LpoB